MGQCAGKPHLATRRAHSGRDSTIENVAARSLQPAEEVEAVEVVDATAERQGVKGTTEVTAEESEHGIDGSSSSCGSTEGVSIGPDTAAEAAKAAVTPMNSLRSEVMVGEVSEEDGLAKAHVATAVSALSTASAVFPTELTLSMVSKSPTRRRRLTSDELEVWNQFSECSSASGSERGDYDAWRDTPNTSEVEYDSDPSSSSSSTCGSSDSEEGVDDDKLRLSDMLSKEQCDQFTLHEVIGKGAFGHVRRATRGTKTYAAKVLMWEAGNEDKANEFVCEMRNLKELKHKHIVRYVGSVLEMDIKRLIIYTEWMPSGSLKDQIDECRTSGKTMSYASVRKYAWQVAGGLAFLHKNNVAHLDLKPANIVRDQDGVVKLTDFGTSRKLMESHSFRDDCGRKRGTVCFMAPEVFLNRTGFESDIWSFGCTVLNLATGNLPWHETGIMDEIMLGVHIATGSSGDGNGNNNGPGVPAVDKVWDADLRAMISRCVQRDRHKRPKIYSLHAMLGFELVGTSPIKSPTKSLSCSQLLVAAADEEVAVVPLSPSNGQCCSPLRARVCRRQHVRGNRSNGGEN